MGQMILSTKKTIINSVADHPLTFWDATYTVLPTAVGARYMNVDGFGTFDLNTIHNVTGHRGLEGFYQVFESVAANYSVAFPGPIPSNTIVRLDFEFVTGLNQNGEYSRQLGLDGKTEVLQILIQPGETVASFNAKIYNAIYNDTNFSSLRELLKTPTKAELLLAGATFSGNSATSITSLPIAAVDADLSFRLKITSDSRNLPSPYVQLLPGLFTPTAFPGFPGRNNYDSLKTKFIDSWDRMPYHFDRILPIQGDLYTSVFFNAVTSRQELGGGVAVNQVVASENSFEIYINDKCLTSIQNPIVDFLDQATILSTINPAIYTAPEWYNAGAYTSPVVGFPAFPSLGCPGSPALATVAVGVFKV